MNSVVLEGDVTGCIKVIDCIALFINTGDDVFHCEAPCEKYNFEELKELEGEKIRVIGRLAKRECFGSVIYEVIAEHIEYAKDIDFFLED